MRKNLYLPGLINTALLICLSFSLYGLLIDLPLISDFKEVYIAGRILTALTCLFFLYQVQIQQKQYEAQVPLIYALIILYCVQGQYFVNGYYLAFMQTIAGFSLFFPMPKKYYYPITIVGNFLILIAIWSTMYVYSESPAKVLKFNVDSSLGIVLISLISFIGYQKITLARQQKQILAEKFLDVGRFFANVIHELKGMSSSPTVYAQLLTAELKKENPRLDFLKEVVGNLTADVDNVNQKIIGINYLSKNSSEVTAVDVKALISAIEKHFFSKDRLGIQIRGNTEKIVCNEYTVRSILLNLFTNSKENFNAKKIKERIIQIEIAPQKITFFDNGGGFTPSALKMMSQNLFFSEKTFGSGMGIFMIKEYMKEFNGRAIIGNRMGSPAGIHVELIFASQDRA